MFNLPFLQKNSPESDKYIFILFLSGEKAYGFAFDETNIENRSTLYQEHVDSFLKNATEKVEKILANVEHDLGENVYLKKAVLVLNSLYTTESGAIREDFLRQIKKLLKTVDLDNLGYLNFYEVINFHFGKKYPHFGLLEESIYDYNLYELNGNEVEKTTKIAKSEDSEGNLKEITKQLNKDLPLTAFFYKKPQEKAIEYKHLLEEGDLAEMFAEVYFKDKIAPEIVSSEPLKEDNYPQVTAVAALSVNEELPLAPGFTSANPELAFKEDIPEKPMDTVLSSPHPQFKFPRLKFNLVIPQMGVAVYLALGVIVLLLCVLGYYFLFHRAEIVLSTKKENYSTTIDFKVSRSSSFVDEFTTKIDISTQATTTGEKITGEKAKGEITVYNGLFEKRDLSSGALFTANNGAKFSLDSDVSVPAATTSADLDQGVVTRAFGKKTVTVTAAEIGAEGNIDNGSKLAYGDLNDNDFYALANADFNGGVKKTVAIFSSADAQNLEKKALTAAKSKLRSEFKTRQNDDVLFPETITTDSLKKSFSEEVGAEANRVTLSYNGNIKAYFTTYRALISEVQARKLKDKEFVDGTFNLTKVELEDTKNGIYDYTAMIKGEVQNLIDQTLLKGKIKGKSINGASTILNDEHNITSSELITKPLPLPILPVSNQAIIIKFAR